MIYFVQNNTVVKIGFTTNIVARLRGLQTATHRPCRVLGVMDGTLADEQKLHRRFKAYRVRGEWFDFSSEIETFIAENCHQPPELTGAPGLAPWNKDKAIGRKKAFTKDQIEVIGRLLKMRAGDRLAARDYALLRLGVDTMLRSSDLRLITIEGVLEDGALKVRELLTIRQLKTGRIVRCTIMPETVDALLNWIKVGWGSSIELTDKLFAISDRHHRNIIKGWAKSLGLATTHYSTHSVRRAKPREIFRQTQNLEAVRQLLGHSSLAATGAYLGFEEEDAMELSRKINI